MPHTPSRTEQIRLRLLDHLAAAPRTSTGLWLDEPVRVEVSDDALSYDVVLTVSTPSVGAVRVESATVTAREHGPEVTGAGLRKTTLGQYLEAVRGVLYRYDPCDEHDEALTLASGWVSAKPASPFEEFEVSPRDTAPPLSEVAQLYRLAVSDPSFEVRKAPTAAVAAKFGVSRGYAARLVSQARTAGHLGPARGTTSGEVTPAQQGERS